MQTLSHQASNFVIVLPLGTDPDHAQPAMATQAALSIPFALAQPQDNVRLMELPPELLEIISQARTKAENDLDL